MSIAQAWTKSRVKVEDLRIARRAILCDMPPPHGYEEFVEGYREGLVRAVQECKLPTQPYAGSVMAGGQDEVWISNAKFFLLLNQPLAAANDGSELTPCSFRS